MRRSPVLVTSGLGNAQGGIGVVADLLRRSLGWDVRIWTHPFRRARPVRRAVLVLQALSAIHPAPGLVVYEHLGLARLHQGLPWLKRTPYAVFLHGIEVWRQLDPIQRRSLEGAAALLVNSETTIRRARTANSWLPQAVVTYLGVKAEDELPMPMASRPEQILMVGRMNSLERYKGHDQVLDAWPGVLAACPAARLVIVGDGDDSDRLRDKARDLRGVAFAGFLPQGALRSKLRESRLLVAPSTSEGFGLNAIEAAMQGTPVLGLRGSVLEELFPGSEVELVADQEPTTIAAGILRILRDPSRAQAKGDMVRRAALACYTDEQAVARIRPALIRWLP